MVVSPGREKPALKKSDKVAVFGWLSETSSYKSGTNRLRETKRQSVKPLPLKEMTVASAPKLGLLRRMASDYLRI